MTAGNSQVRQEVLDRADVRCLTADGLNHRVLTFRGHGTEQLFFVPGITSPAETMEFVASALPEFTVHVPDLRGRGRSDRARAGEYTLEHYRRDLAALVSVLGLDSPVVVGHSLGARIAAAWAVTAEPTAARVVLVDPPLSGPGRRPYPMTAESFAAQLDEARAGTTPEAVRQYFPHWPERELRLRAEVLAECDETAVRETHRGFEEEDFFEIWDGLSADTSLIHGANSPVVSTSDVEELSRRNPLVPITAVPGAGHMVPWDNLDGFVHALRASIPTSAKSV